MAFDTIHDLTHCAICDGTALETVFDLKNHTLSGIFVDRPDTSYPVGFDQSLMACAQCGHVQLRRVLPTHDLYGEEYAHRSSKSFLIEAANEGFIDFVISFIGERRIRCAVEIGCNDLELIRRLSQHADFLVGIDPIWIDQEPPVEPNMRLIGGFAENIDFSQALPERPDLVVSAHCLEHIEDPVEIIQRLMGTAAPDALFVIEVPDLHSMVSNLRFDKVFHQHIHYFSLQDLMRLIERVGGYYLGSTVNYRNWGGSVFVAFSKNKTAKPALSTHIPDSTRINAMTERYQLFRTRIAQFMELIEGIDCCMTGYGAGQMVPIVAYHMESDLSFLDAILDDDSSRNGLYYPHLAPKIQLPDDSTNLSDRTVMITALDAVRPVMSRLRDLDPRFIVTPANVY